MSSSVDTTPDTAQQTSARGAAVGAYLRANPVSAGLAVVLTLTAIYFGTVGSEAVQQMAAGPVTTGQLRYWWTPVTALLIPDSAIEAVLSVALALTVMAYAERLLGSVRTVVVYLGVGAAAFLVGVGIETLGAFWGESWATLAELEFVLDPPVGIFAVIMAASALAPVLFRRRIRIIGFATLVMFALYAGDSDSVYRLVAALLGLAVGLMFGHGVSRAPWHRSSFRETRMLIAAIVAVAGLGPLIVLLSGTANGPLSLVLAGFPVVDVDEVFTRCATETSAQCDSDVALALTAGVGPFVMSLVPLVLSVVAAWGLRTGRRAAWILGIAVNVAVAILAATSLGAASVFDADVVAVLGIEFGFWVLAAVLVPLSVAVLLAVTWRRFRVTAPRAALRQFLVTVVVAFLALALVNVLLGLVLPGDYLETPAIGALLASIIRLFVPAGFITGIPLTVAPVDGLPLIAFQWSGVVFWAVFVLATLLLYRATAVGRATEEEERFRALLRRGGGGTLGFMGTWPGNSYWFSADGDGAVAYRVIGRVALTLSDPVCAEGDDLEVVRGFVDYCDSQGWVPVFYSAHERYLPVFHQLGWQTMSVGEETVLDLQNLEMAGKPWQKIRQALNKGTRAGIVTLWSTWDDLPASASAQIDAISEQWVAEKELPEMGFTLGGIEELKDPEVQLFLAMDADGRLEAITSWLPSWTDGVITGWTIDFMRRGDDSMPGIMEFVIASAALHMKELGAQVMSLSGAPLATKPDEVPAEATVMTRLLGWLRDVLEPAYGFTSLFRFKSKFNPRYTTIYMAYADPVDLPNIGMAIGKAYLPEVSPKEYVALGRTLTGRGGSGSHD